MINHDYDYVYVNCQQPLTIYLLRTSKQLRAHLATVASITNFTNKPHLISWPTYHEKNTLSCMLLLGFSNYLLSIS